MQNYTKVPISRIESTAHSSLNTARLGKPAALALVKSLRAKIKANPLGNSGYRLDLLEADSRYRELLRMEESALRHIEAEANKLGLTTTDKFRKADAAMEAQRQRIMGTFAH